MRLLLPLATLLSVASAAVTEKTIDIFAWPLSAPKSQAFARISYTFPSLNATLQSHTTPPIPSDEQLVRIGYFRSSSPSDWSGIATSAQNLSPAYEKKLHLVVDSKGEVLHIAFTALPAAPPVGENTKRAKGAAAPKPKDGLVVEVVRQKPGPQPHLNKPVVLSPEGKVEEGEPEKTFLAKYWWAIGLFLLFQAVMSGGGGDK